MVGRGRGGDARCRMGDVEGCGFFDIHGSFGYTDERPFAYQTKYIPWLAVQMSWPANQITKEIHLS